MNNTDIFKNIWAYQKAGFENAYNSAVAIHNKTEGWLDDTLEKSPFIPEQGREFLKSWMNTVKETREGFKNYVSEQQSRFETLWTKPQ